MISNKTSDFKLRIKAHRGSKWVKMITRNVITYEEIRG